MSDDSEPLHDQSAPRGGSDQDTNDTNSDARVLDNGESAAGRQERTKALRQMAQRLVAQPPSAAPTAQAAPSATARPSVWRMSLSAGVAASQRRLRLVAIVSVALLVAVVGGALALHSATGATLPGLVPGATLLPGQVAQVYLDADVPWSRVTLDGRPITLPIIGQQPPLTLTPGRHVLRWIAAPFEPQSCILSLPASSDDTCQLAPSEIVSLPHEPQARLVYLRESLATLVTPQQVALTRAIQAALSDDTATAQPGEIYSIPPGTAGEQIASQPLRMTLGETLNASAEGIAMGTGSGCFYPFDQDNNACQLEGRNCGQLCTLPFAAHASLPSPDPHAWYVFALSELTWRYATPGGQVLLSPTSWLIDFGGQIYAGQPVLLRLRWMGAQWNVQQMVGPNMPRQMTLNDDGTPIPSDPACFDAYQLISSLYGLSAQTALQSYSQARFISGPNPAEGCLAEMTVGTPGKAPANGAPVAEYLDRFGELYLVRSVNAPLLNRFARPPSALEVQVAQTLATYPGQTVMLPANTG